MPLGLQTASLNFDLLTEVGQAGKNSQVYLAHDHQLSGKIVIKKINKTTLTYDGDYYKEAKILYNHEHTNIAKVNYGCEDDEYVYIAMPFYENGSLKDLLLKRHLTVREIIRYSIQFLSGLSHIHAKKLMHFDIKPDNIFLTNSDEAVLADFGLAKAMDIYNIAEQEFVYFKQIPPEALTGDIKSYPFDIYLAGLTMYRMCNGVDFFDKQFDSYNPDNDEFGHAILKGTFPLRDAYLWHIPSSLVKTINKSLSVNPSERHQNALELINELSLIDKNLDWNYSLDGDDRIWEIDKEDKVIQIKVSNNGNDFVVLTQKTMKNSGKQLKITEYCNTNIISKDLKKFVVKALKELQ